GGGIVPVAAPHMMELLVLGSSNASPYPGAPDHRWRHTMSRCLVMLLCALGFLWGCDDNAHQDDPVRLDTADVADATDDVPSDAESQDTADMGDDADSADADTIGCLEREMLCTQTGLHGCGLMGGCRSTACVCRGGYEQTASDVCTVRTHEDCTIGDTGPPARFHVTLGTDQTGENGLARLFPYDHTVNDTEY